MGDILDESVRACSSLSGEMPEAACNLRSPGDVQFIDLHSPWSRQIDSNFMSISNLPASGRRSGTPVAPGLRSSP